MRNYFKDKSAIPIPWTESPFYKSLANNSSLTIEEREACDFYNQNGYLEIDLELTDEEIQPIVDDMYKALEDEKTKFHAEHFQYTESKRIFELWKQSEASAQLCMNKKVIDTLRLLYNREPFPFSTINFTKGSNQPLHSDVIHFHTVPSRWMVGVWIAFEDVDETNGSLKIIPGSHNWNIWEYDELGFPHPDEILNGEKENYRNYEQFLIDLVKEKNAKSYITKLKKGQALIWAANLLHGGSNIDGVTDLSKTRLTQVQHYFFEGCEKYYHPMFTKKYLGQYAEKWCNDNNNIRSYLESGSVTMFDKQINLEK
jgi:ectoine hydroxylase-related dioxygenase (phytanoyl-CoA dioxygenase family)